MSFNSQRDGILLKCKNTRRSLKFEFQFPTGWNSTLNKIRSEYVFESFNSQRDGILLWNYDSAFLFVLFQFPTGWNSTIFIRVQNFSRRVSIPNGMEFYWVFTLINFRWISFNSQRDGILLYMFYILYYIKI